MMSDSETILPPVHWHEGMMLSPQHFQQNNIYLEQLMQHQLKQVSPYSFGIFDIQFKQPMGESITITDLHAVMPDGTVVQYEVIQEGKLLTLDLSEIETTPGEPFFVYLAVVKRSVLNGKLQRYESVNMGKVADLDHINNQVDVVRSITRLHLLTEDQLSGNFSYLPILAFKEEDGVIQLQPFTPAMPFFRPLKDSVSGYAELYYDTRKKLLALWEILERKLAYAAKRQFSSDNQEMKATVNYLVNHLPSLMVMVESHNCNPFQIYCSLINLTSCVNILRSDDNDQRKDFALRKYSKYQPDNILGTFSRPLEDLGYLAARLDVRFRTEPVTINKHGEFLINVGDVSLGEEIMLAFKLPSITHAEQTKAWIEAAHMGQLEYLPELKKWRGKGTKRQSVKNFNEINVIQDADELFYRVTIDEQCFPSLTDDEATEPNVILAICGADENIDVYAPARLVWFSENVKPEKTCSEDE